MPSLLTEKLYWWSYTTTIKQTDGSTQTNNSSVALPGLTAKQSLGNLLDRLSEERLLYFSAQRVTRRESPGE